MLELFMVEQVMQNVVEIMLQVIVLVNVLRKKAFRKHLLRAVHCFQSYICSALA